MKPVIGSLFLVGLFIAHTALGGEVVVSLSPHKLTLVPGDYEDQSGWQKLTLTLSNQTHKRWRFNKFYLNWSPILLEPDGTVSSTGFNRDWISPARHFFPFLKHGQSTTITPYCRVVQSKDGLALVLHDGIGGSTEMKVEPGEYKFCVEYRMLESWEMLPWLTKQINLAPSEVWWGWSVSNWIDLSIRAGANKP